MVCVCVRESERERECVRAHPVLEQVDEKLCVCVCVCVCERVRAFVHTLF